MVDSKVHQLHSFESSFHDYCVHCVHFEVSSDVVSVAEAYVSSEVPILFGVNETSRGIQAIE